MEAARGLGAGVAAGTIRAPHLLPRSWAPEESCKSRGHGVVRALFWGKPRLKSLEREFSLSSQLQSDGVVAAQGSSDQLTTITVSLVSTISTIPADDWDACALDAAGGVLNPFVTHAFLSCLEDSKSAVADEGWLPQHLVARDDNGAVLGVVPLYLKSHSYGEYVFDHSWASAYRSYGHMYYPKLQSCVPFTPATGPRILVRHGPLKQQVFAGICKALRELAHQSQASSVHVTFATEDEWKEMGKHNFLQRMGVQYHWFNAGYKSFDDFLATLRHTKRKRIRQERKKIQDQKLKLKRLRGDDIKAHHWDAFFNFYRNTTDNKWGQAYLTREFFHLLGSRLGDKVLLVTAEDGETLVAGALNLIGDDTLYGRNWGSLPNVFYPMLHFEACYYQAIEAAIEWKLEKVEAGAQGEHKLQRGYVPTATYSAHYIPDPDFRAAIADFLIRETAQVKLVIQVLDESSPYKAVEEIPLEVKKKRSD
ncbi:uncharacterized protein LOC9659961 [Selaginella moellendorffii]|uniref:uncharacterized protein LOC9659961 n=1 Tax=Selaginella moellendorffii TaxID=88036 RepID=UPI000D1C9238|nr:uncharacterized protein LOC9659961 [Selaginella moellendorffii]|eukprot:XP_002965170.2 uncharacterized protein LOC9659961 [Selaginella moellendorffii]